jgi:pantetheine-phosphate adenylyltransferase
MKATPMTDRSRRAVFPGSFDPITRGHENILRRAATLFDEVIVAIGVNQDKQGMFPLEKRIAWCEATFADLPNVRVASFEGLTVDFCQSVQAGWLIRGVRNGGDFEYERTIAQMTKYLDDGVETMILFTDPEFAPISSSVVRDVVHHGGDVARFVPDAVDLGGHGK